MFLTITYLKLRSPLNYFTLVLNVMKISRQLSTTGCTAHKFRGFLTEHFTLTLWNSQQELKTFARSGAHLEAMKKSAVISKEIRTLTIEASHIPAWEEAKALLFKDGKIIKF